MACRRYVHGCRDVDLDSAPDMDRGDRQRRRDRLPAVPEWHTRSDAGLDAVDGRERTHGRRFNVVSIASGGCGGKLVGERTHRERDPEVTDGAVEPVQERDDDRVDEGEHRGRG